MKVDSDGSGGSALLREHLRRPRLVQELREARLGLIEAGSGYGKSALAAEYGSSLGVAVAVPVLGPGDAEAGAFVTTLRRALSTARLSDLVAAVEGKTAAARVESLLDALAATDQPVLIVVDDAHHAGEGEAAQLVLRLSRLSAPHRLLISTRRLAPPLNRLLSTPGVVAIGQEQLAFTESEVCELAESRGLALPARAVRVLHDATGGWAAALQMAIAALVMSDDPARAAAELPRGAAAPAALLDGLLASLSAEDRDGLGQLAHLRLISSKVTEAVTGSDGAFDRMLSAGIPFARTPGSWWELSGPAADLLGARSILTPEAAEAAAGVYAEAGQVAVALETLLLVGRTRRAAALLDSLAPGEVEEFGAEAAAGVVEALDEEAVRSHPRVLVQLARVAEATYHADLRRGALERASRLDAEGALDGRILRELEAERARDLLWDEPTRPEAVARARAVADMSGKEEAVARARALDVLGRARCWMTADGPPNAAEPLLLESARLSRSVGARTWAAQALVPLGWGVYFASCRYEQALTTLDAALADLPVRSRYRAVVQSFKSDVLTELGRGAEAAASVAEMREIGQAFGEDWALAFASWAEARTASYAGDRQRTVEAVLDVERHRGEWYEQVGGLEFLAHSADLLDRVGERRLAVRQLEQAHERAESFDRPVRLYASMVEARSGDPELAEELIAAMLARRDLQAQEQWHLELMRAYAAHRRADPAAAALAAVAFDTSLRLGHPEGPLIREPVAADALVPLAAEAGSLGATELLAGAGRVSIWLLGGFRLTRGGRALALPPGRPATAVRAVAACGGRLHAEQLSELLWPNADPDAARNRLRNLLSRIRASAGDILVREGEAVALAQGTTVDAAGFEAEAREALALRTRGETYRSRALATSALGRYVGELLPADRYESWAALPRERLSSLHLDLLDMAAADAEERAEVDEAVRILRRAIDAEPHDEVRYLKLASLLASQGRAGSAATTVRRARAALAEIGLEPSEQLAALEARFGRAIRPDSRR